MRIFEFSQSRRLSFSDFINKKPLILQAESRGRDFPFSSSLVSFGLIGSHLVSITVFGGLRYKKKTSRVRQKRRKVLQRAYLIQIASSFDTSLSNRKTLFC